MSGTENQYYNAPIPEASAKGQLIYLIEKYLSPDAWTIKEYVGMYNDLRTPFANFMIAYRRPWYSLYAKQSKELAMSIKGYKDQDTFISKLQNIGAQFLAWYIRYADLMAYDSYNLERIKLFGSERTFNRPDPFYLTIFPPIKVLASKIAVLILIPFVEAGLIINSAAASIREDDASIFGNKLLNTASVLFNNYLLIPDIVGFFRASLQSREYLRETVTEAGRVPRKNYLVSDKIDDLSAGVGKVRNLINSTLVNKLAVLKEKFSGPDAPGADTSEANHSEQADSMHFISDKSRVTSTRSTTTTPIQLDEIAIEDDPMKVQASPEVEQNIALQAKASKKNIDPKDFFKA